MPAMKGDIFDVSVLSLLPLMLYIGGMTIDHHSQRTLGSSIHQCVMP